MLHAHRGNIVRELNCIPHQLGIKRQYRSLASKAVITNSSRDVNQQRELRPFRLEVTCCSYALSMFVCALMLSTSPVSGVPVST